MEFQEHGGATTALADPAAPASDAPLEGTVLVAKGGGPADAVPKRRRGRPLQMTPEIVLELIRQLARREEGLFRVHRSHSGLYARARRQFGSWSEAVRQAGVDYDAAVDTARSRALRNRRRRNRQLAKGRLEKPESPMRSTPLSDDMEEDFSRS